MAEAAASAPPVSVSAETGLLLEQPKNTEQHSQPTTPMIALDPGTPDANTRKVTSLLNGHPPPDLAAEPTAEPTTTSGARNLTSLFETPNKDDLKDPVVPIVVDRHPDGTSSLERIPSMEGLNEDNYPPITRSVAAIIPAVDSIKQAAPVSNENDDDATTTKKTIVTPHSGRVLDIGNGIKHETDKPGPKPAPITTTTAATATETLPSKEDSSNTVPGEKTHLTANERYKDFDAPPESQSNLAGAHLGPGVSAADATLQTKASQIPYQASRAAALKEKFKGLESSISGLPGTKENPTPDENYYSGTYRSATRSAKEMHEKILPAVAQFLMTFDPFVNIAGITVVALVAWSIGNWGWSWIWTVLGGICAALYIVKIRGTMAKAVDFERKRNEATLSLGTNVESAEWVNFFLAQIWTIIDPSLFTAAIDTLEDQFIASAPTFITQIRIADFELGPRAPRITSLQVYPQASGEDAILMDVTVAMHPSPQEIASRTRLNTHLLIEVHLGHPKLGSVAVPIMVEECGLEAQVRVWLKMSSKAPFVKTLKFCLLNKPHINFSVRPLKLGNIMNLPILSQFITTVMDQVITDMLVSPKVMALELDRLLMGDAALADTRALGVIKVVFRSAKHLRGADWGVRGSTSDPYATLGFGNSTKFLARTRIIPKDRSPVWNETHYAVITEEDVKNGFPLSVKVWDYDAISRNDVLGQFEIRTEELVDSDGVVFDGWKSLLKKKETGGDKDKTEKAEMLAKNGKLDFQIGFYPKTDGKSRRVDADKWTSGILAVQVHQALDLIIRPKDRNGVYPSPYVHAYVNDQRAFSTRIKQHNPSPVWATTHEFFIRDWKHTLLRLVVKDARQHEHDPVIGVVILRLADLFKDDDDMYTSGWHDLEGGIGFGRLRVSLAFRSVILDEDPHMKGFGVGELSLKNISCRGLDSMTKHSSSPPPNICIKIRSPLTDPSKLSTHHTKEPSFSPSFDDDLRIKVKSRYQTALRFEVHQKGLFGLRDKILGVGKMYLQDLVDNQSREVTLGLKRLRHRGRKAKVLGGEDHLDTTDKGVLAKQDRDKESVIDLQRQNATQGDEAMKDGTATDGSGKHESTIQREDTTLNSLFVPEDDAVRDDVPSPTAGPREQWEGSEDSEDEDASSVRMDYNDELDAEGGNTDTDDDTESVVSFESDERVSNASSPASSTVMRVPPEITFRALFRPGRSWLDSPREGEEAEVSFLDDAKEHHGDPTTAPAFDSLPPSPSSSSSKNNRKSISASTAPSTAKEDSRLPGNKFTRTLEWSKDTVLDGVKSTRLWKKSSKKTLGGEGHEF
ncbi:hypothetical protein DFS34DRAFT_701363 [Phlyctochytrium arcticum]|nr:hypothetical protein DFS34DRAFT_701363 [Phlyctochytrium arcticum]